MRGGKKYCTVIKEMEKMLVILSEIWSYLKENFKLGNSGPYQIGHNKRLLSVVIISGAYCNNILCKIGVIDKYINHYSAGNT